jgi:hypothetical protein
VASGLKRSLSIYVKSEQEKELNYNNDWATYQKDPPIYLMKNHDAPK